MKLFLSGFGHRDVEIDPRVPPGMRYRLLSCHPDYLRAAQRFSRALSILGQPFELMYDSGAFTAWSQGQEEIKLDALIRIYDTMLARYARRATAVWLISLDKIPGRPRQRGTPEEIDEACVVSDRNFEALRKRFGERVLPVLHQTEPVDRWHEVAAMAGYICVSPRNDLPESYRREWVRDVHLHLRHNRMHGLATTGYRMMTRKRWASVDSATWVLVAKNGAVFRDERLRTLRISERGDDYRKLPKTEQRAFHAFVESRGFTIPALARRFFDRLIFNRVVMTEMAQALP